MLILRELTKISKYCPTQWEGRTTDNQYVYIRYRYAKLSVGIGDTYCEAVDNSRVFINLDIAKGKFLGQISWEEVKLLMKEVLEFSSDFKYLDYSESSPFYVP